MKNKIILCSLGSRNSTRKPNVDRNHNFKILLTYMGPMQLVKIFFLMFLCCETSQIPLVSTQKYNPKVTTSTLFDLPEDLGYHIFGYLECDHTSLKNVMFTCRSAFYKEIFYSFRYAKENKLLHGRTLLVCSVEDYDDSKLLLKIGFDCLFNAEAALALVPSKHSSKNVVKVKTLCNSDHRETSEEETVEYDKNVVFCIEIELEHLFHSENDACVKLVSNASIERIVFSSFQINDLDSFNFLTLTNLLEVHNERKDKVPFVIHLDSLVQEGVISAFNRLKTNSLTLILKDTVQPSQSLSFLIQKASLIIVDVHELESISGFHHTVIAELHPNYAVTKYFEASDSQKIAYRNTDAPFLNVFDDTRITLSSDSTDSELIYQLLGLGLVDSLNVNSELNFTCDWSQTKFDWIVFRASINPVDFSDLVKRTKKIHLVTEIPDEHEYRIALEESDVEHIIIDFRDGNSTKDFTLISSFNHESPPHITLRNSSAVPKADLLQFANYLEVKGHEVTKK